MKWKNWSDFKGQHSIQLRGDNWSKIEILSSNSQARYRNCINEINCMNDSIDFQDAESVRSGHFHVTSQPAFFPPFPDPGGMLTRSVGILSRNDKPPDIWDTHGISGNVFVIPTASSSSLYPGGFNPWISNVSEHTSPHAMRERQTPVQDQRCQSVPSAKNQSSLVREILQRIMQQTNNNCRFQIFISTTFACWKIRFKTEVRPCSKFHTEAMHWIKEVEMVDSVDDLKSSRSMRGTHGPDFEVFDARIASALNRIIHNSHFKRRVSLEEQKAPKRGPFPSRQADCLLDLRVLPGHWSPWFCRKLCGPIYSCSSKWRYSRIRFEMVRNSIVYDENPTWWYLGRIVQIKNTRVWEAQDRIGIVWPGDSPVEVRTWISQIEENGEKKYRAESTN